MNLTEAERILEVAFPMQGVTITTTDRGTYQIKRPNGELIGSAFDLRKALEQACKPVLEAEAKRLLAEGEAKKREFVMFMAFLREKFDAEFLEYRTKNTPVADPASNAGGTQPDPARLVSIIP